MNNSSNVVIIILYLNVLSLHIQAQNALNLFEVERKQGLYNAQTNQIIIPAIYQSIEISEDDLLAVQPYDTLKTYFGYIDTTGKVVIPFQYLEAQNFKNGIALVKDTLGWFYYIDKTGKDVFNYRFLKAESFQEGLAAVEYLPDLYQKEQINISKDSARRIFDIEAIKSSFINQQGQFQIDLDKFKNPQQKPLIFNTLSNFKQGVALVESRFSDFYGDFFINKKGEKLFKVQDKLKSFKTPKDCFTRERLTFHITDYGQILWLAFVECTYQRYEGIYAIKKKITAFDEQEMEEEAKKNPKKKKKKKEYFRAVFHRAYTLFSMTDLKGNFLIKPIPLSAESAPQIVVNEKELLMYYKDTLYQRNREKPFNEDLPKENTLTKEVINYDRVLWYRNDTKKSKILSNLQEKQSLPYDSLFFFKTNIHLPSIHYLAYKNNRVGLINERGEWIFPPQYEMLIPLENRINLAALLKGKWGIINPINKILIPFEYDSLYQPNYVIPDKFICLKKQGKWHLFDLLGNLQIEAFDNISFQKGKIIIQKNGKTGILDEKTYRVILPFEYDELIEPEHPYSWNQPKPTELYIAKMNQKLGLINLSNELLLKLEYDSIFPQASWGDYILCQNGKYGFYSYTDKLQILCEYQNANLDNQGNLILQNENKFGLLKIHTLQRLNCEYDSLTQHYRKESLILVKKNNNWGVYDLNEKNFIIPLAYQHIIPLADSSYFMVRKNSLWGVVNAKNEIIAPLNFDKIIDQYVTDGGHPGASKYEYGVYFNVIQNKKEGLFNVKGQLIIPIRYNEIGQINMDENLPIAVLKDSLWGFYDKKGNEIVPNRYRYAIAFHYPFDNEKFEPIKIKAFAFVFEKEGWAVMDTSGKLLTPFKYSDIYLDHYSAKNEKTYYIQAYVKNSFKRILIDLEGQEYIEEE